MCYFNWFQKEVKLLIIPLQTFFDPSPFGPSLMKIAFLIYGIENSANSWSFKRLLYIIPDKIAKIGLEPSWAFLSLLDIVSCLAEEPIPNPGPSHLSNQPFEFRIFSQIAPSTVWK